MIEQEHKENTFIWELVLPSPLTEEEIKNTGMMTLVGPFPKELYSNKPMVSPPEWELSPNAY